MRLSKNLSLSEVVKSNTAKRLGIDNTPGELHIENLKRVAKNIFQPLRDHFGVAIGISSGYRHPLLNSRIGGAKRSQHTKGEALDIDADMYGGITNTDIFFYVMENLPYDTIIAEYCENGHPAWVHVSYREGKNRGKALIAIREGGRTKYIKYSPENWKQFYGTDSIDLGTTKSDSHEKL